MYAIAGVTGHTGKVIADTLLSQGRKVRVIVRSEEKGKGYKGPEPASEEFHGHHLGWHLRHLAVCAPELRRPLR